MNTVLKLAAGLPRPSRLVSANARAAAEGSQSLSVPGYLKNLEFSLS